MALTVTYLKRPGTTLSDSVANVYSLASGKAYIKMILLHNTSGSSTETIAIYNVPNSGAAYGTPSASGSGNNQMYNFTLAPKATELLEFPQPIVLLHAYDSIWAKSTTASTVTIQIYGATDTA